MHTHTRNHVSRFYTLSRRSVHNYSRMYGPRRKGPKCSSRCRRRLYLCMPCNHRSCGWFMCLHADYVSQNLLVLCMRRTGRNVNLVPIPNTPIYTLSHRYTPLSTLHQHTLSRGDSKPKYANGTRSRKISLSQRILHSVHCAQTPPNDADDQCRSRIAVCAHYSSARYACTCVVKCFCARARALHINEHNNTLLG